MLSAMLAFIIMMTSFAALSLTVSADSMYIKKIVSVVYDDSGSMLIDEKIENKKTSPKWIYANYAMQTFCGMLNSEDQLFITYMSSAKTVNGDLTCEAEEIKISEGKIQKSVDAIREHDKAGATPYAAVEAAIEKLESVKNTDPNTQYWLVIITDGGFNDFSMNEKGQYNSPDEQKKILDEKIGEIIQKKMPNATKPQINFMTIGSGTVAPTEDKGKGIHTYKAETNEEIIVQMAKMADSISGRKRLEGDALKTTESNNIIRVSSELPLQNIVVLEQGSDAFLDRVELKGEKKDTYTPSRNVFLEFAELKGRTFLVEESKKGVIPAGEYDIVFDKAVKLDDIVVLFEPALYIDMKISVNGKEITDKKELKNIAEGDKISISYKIFEIGTDKEIESSLLNDAEFKILVTEGDEIAVQENGTSLTDYVVKKEVETEIKASVTIEGFSPIEYSIDFNAVPVEVNYSIKSEFKDGKKSIRKDELASNKDFSIYFTVYKDGEAMTDPEEVKALATKELLAQKGMTFADDGKIVFTPTSVQDPGSHNGSFDVNVTCSIDDGKGNTASATETYTVIVANYAVVAVDSSEKITKTQFFGNKIGASFYITKDGKQLSKKDVEQGISAAFNEEHADLKMNIEVADDGTITIIPYSEKEYTLTFWSWWINWARYFSLSGDDIEVTLNHPLGTAESKIDVVEESIQYQILNVYLPLLIELIALALLVTWIVLIITKPRFTQSAKLYVGEIKYNKDGCTHILRNFSVVNLDKFNQIKRGHGRLKFKKTADVVSANGINIRADHGGRIICEMPFPWYRNQIEPTDTDLENLRTPADILAYFTNHRKLEINEFATTETVDEEHKRGLTSAAIHRPKYIAVPDSTNGVTVIEERKVIKSGKIFIYING